MRQLYLATLAALQVFVIEILNTFLDVTFNLNSIGRLDDVALPTSAPPASVAEK